MVSGVGSVRDQSAARALRRDFISFPPACRASVAAKQRRYARDGAGKLPSVVLADPLRGHLPLLIAQSRRVWRDISVHRYGSIKNHTSVAMMWRGSLQRWVEVTRQYNAVLLIGQDDQGPLDLSGAQNDDQAIEIGRKQAIEWLRANGIEGLTLQIVENGRGIHREVRL